MEEIKEPAGIAFFSVKTGETHYGKLEPTIQAYINSSDMGINASRGQDFGWRLDAEWVKRVRAFRRDRTQMAILSAKNQGNKPTTTQILYYIYGEELANYYEEQEEHENPFEEAYLAAIASGNSPAIAAAQAGMPQALADFKAAEEDALADDDLLAPEEGAEDGDISQPADSTASAAAPGKTQSVPDSGDESLDPPEEPGRSEAPGAA